CHSDLHVMRGDVPAPLPAILGHEGAGVVEAVGDGVTSVKPGDHVVFLWRASCGHCYFCSRGRPALCDMGAGIRWSGRLADGTSRYRRDAEEIRHFAGVSSFAEYSVLPEAGVIPIRRDVPLDKAATVGCAVMTGVGAAINAAKVEPGASVVVIGCGGVGLNVIQGAALAGAERIIAVDVLPNKLEYARVFGATHTLNARDGGVVEAVRELTEGRGADYAFEVIGRPETIRQVYEVIRRGGTAVVVGIAPTTAEVSLNASSIMLQEKTLRGTLYGSCVPHTDVPRLLGLYVAGKLKLDELISREYPIEQINDAFAALERGEVARSIIRFSRFD
ncbi:MAG: Zn-dependent alcohol dehydrogenase, partial [Chloroflexi bacterium]|nr:Zn-dependent alcohol dehydrogenase [Chloroflexota bacterium]